MAYKFSFIKSIQFFQTNTNQTITSVDTNNTILIRMGHTSTDVAARNREDARLALASATSVTYAFSVDNPTVSYAVVEFYPGILKSVQSGTITLNSTSVTATITSVNTNKAFILYLGHNGAIGDAALHTQSVCKVVLTNATTVTASVTDASISTTVGFMVVEFK